MCRFVSAEARQSVRDDGTNSAKIAEAISDFTVNQETPTELMFTSGGQSRTVPRGGYLHFTGGVVTSGYANADDFSDALTAISTADHVHDITLTSGGAKPM